MHMSEFCNKHGHFSKATCVQCATDAITETLVKTTNVLGERVEQAINKAMLPNGCYSSETARAIRESATWLRAQSGGAPIPSEADRLRAENERVKGDADRVDGLLRIARSEVIRFEADRLREQCYKFELLWRQSADAIRQLESERAGVRAENERLRHECRHDLSEREGVYTHLNAAEKEVVSSRVRITEFKREVATLTSQRDAANACSKSWSEEVTRLRAENERVKGDADRVDGLLRIARSEVIRLREKCAWKPSRSIDAPPPPDGEVCVVKISDVGDICMARYSASEAKWRGMYGGEITVDWWSRISQLPR
jgi:hypothetical protein